MLVITDSIAPLCGNRHIRRFLSRPFGNGTFAGFCPGRVGHHSKRMGLVGSALRAAEKGAIAAAAWGQMAVDDWMHLRRTLDGNDIDAWDPDYIRRLLPAWRAVMGTYFRGEVRGLENIPEEGPSLLVGTHSGGTLIA